MILLFHETATDAKISTPASLGREKHPPRHYQAQGHFLALDGPGHVIAHDAEDICKIPGWRLATPQEQDVYHGRLRQDSAIHEDTSAPAESSEMPAGDGDEGQVAGEENEDGPDTSTDVTSTPEQADSPQASNTTAPTRGKRRK